jgi:undecaprenyl-diphosphatase
MLMSQSTDTARPAILSLDGRETAPIAWKQSPFDRRGLLIMLATFVVATATTITVGLMIVRWWEPSAAGRADERINLWLEDARTERWNTIAERASQFSDTLTKVLLGVVLLPLFLWLFRRWHEYALIFAGLVLEVAVFGLSSSVVGRDRPPVERLDGAPTQSFPSGHIAAATVFYGGLAVVIFMRTRHAGARIVAVLIGGLMPLVVMSARLYLGMHYLTDAIGGLLLGVTVLVVMYRVVHRTLPADESPELHDGRDDARARVAADHVVRVSP